VKGTRACQETSGRAQALGAGYWGTRVIRRRLDCLKPNLQKMKVHIRRKDVRYRRRPCDGEEDRPSQPLGPGAMPSEGIEGDEWDAYVTLLRATGTNVGSPTGREPYGDGGLVVVAGVTSGQGGRESRPQGEGGQVIGHRESGGMRNAECRNGAGCPA